MQQHLYHENFFFFQNESQRAVERSKSELRYVLKCGEG